MLMLMTTLFLTLAQADCPDPDADDCMEVTGEAGTESPVTEALINGKISNAQEEDLNELGFDEPTYTLPGHVDNEPEDPDCAEETAALGALLTELQEKWGDDFHLVDALARNYADADVSGKPSHLAAEVQHQIVDTHREREINDDAWAYYQALMAWADCYEQ